MIYIEMGCKKDVPEHKLNKDKAMEKITMSEKKNTEFQEKFKDLQKSLIALCKKVVQEKIDSIDKIYIYCCIEKVVQSFSFFTIVDNKVRRLEQLGIKDVEYFDTAYQVFVKIKDLCKEYEEPQPEEIKIIYDVKADTFESMYKYEPMSKEKFPSDVPKEWFEKTRRELEPKRGENLKKNKKIMTLKKVWNYKHAGLRGTVISMDGLLEEHALTYFLEYGKKGFYESQLICLDLREKEPEALFTEGHVIRSIGFCENGRRYFNSFSGKLYCLDDTTGEIIWSTEAGKGNASWKMNMDEKHIYMFNDKLYCIEKVTGNIVWERNKKLEHSNCAIVVQEGHIYHGYSGGAVYCMDKNNGDILWKYGEDLYPQEIILIGNDKILVTTANSLGEILLLDKTSGELISKVTTERQIYRSPVMEENLIYVGNEAGEVYCFELTEKNEFVQKFRILADSEINTSVVIEDNVMWFATEKGYIYGLNKLTGEEVVKTKKCAAGPRWIGFYEGGLLVLSDKGQVEFYQK